MLDLVLENGSFFWDHPQVPAQVSTTTSTNSLSLSSLSCCGVSVSQERLSALFDPYAKAKIIVEQATSCDSFRFDCSPRANMKGEILVDFK